MSGKNMTLDVLVRLKDFLSSPLRRLTGSLKALGDMGRRIGLVGSAIAAISFVGPIAQAAEFQQKLLDISLTANKTGSEAFAMVAQLTGQYQDLGLKIGQTSDDISSGAGQMIAAGIELGVVDRSLKSVGISATAANAQFSDMASVATSMLQNLKLPTDQLDGAMAALTVQGKEGAFELKNMAREFPKLTGQMVQYGVKGREAVNFLGAALQISMKGTSDPATAANNLANFLAKIKTQETAQKFRDMGVDIAAVMQNAATRGINPIEAVIQKIGKLSGTSGDEIAGLMNKAKANGLEGADALAKVREQLEKIHGATAIGGLFGDQQVMDFLIPMMANLEEYKRIRDAGANATPDVVTKDFETQMQGINRQLITMQEVGTQAVREVGNGFATWLPTINDSLKGILESFRELNTNYDGLGSKMIGWAGAAVLLAAGLGAIGIAAPAASAGLAILFAPVKWLMGGLMWLGGLILSVVVPALAAISAPVWLAIGAITALGLAIWYWWDDLPGLAKSISDGIVNLADNLNEMGGRWGQAGMEMGKAMWDGLKSSFDAVLEWFKSLPDMIRSAIGTIDLTGLFTWPGLPSLPGGDDPQSKPTTPAALGALMGNRAAAYVPSPSSQQVDVGGSIRVQIDGPGKVTGMTSDNASVPVTANRGRMLGHN